MEKGLRMNIFEQFDNIDEQINVLKENSNKDKLQQLNADSGSVSGGMGFGTLHHNGAMTTGMIDGQLVNLHHSGSITTGSIGGNQTSVYQDGANTYIY